MATFDDLLAAIATQLRSVADIGIVHDHERYAKDEAKNRVYYIVDVGGKKQLRGWYIKRLSFNRTSPSAPIGARIVVRTSWSIVGFQGLEEADTDGSELEFQRRIDAFAAAYTADPTLGGKADFDQNSQFGPQLAEFASVQFCGVLCHRAKLNLQTVHRE